MGGKTLHFCFHGTKTFWFVLKTVIFINFSPSFFEDFLLIFFTGPLIKEQQIVMILYHGKGQCITENRSSADDQHQETGSKKS